MKTRDMKKTYNFGKIAWNGGRKINDVELDVELRETDKGPEFSVCASIWNNRRTDIVAGGQCLEELVPFLSENELFMKIYGFWEKYHLNSIHAGTPEQEAYLVKNRKWRGDYTKDCECLKKVGLYEVTLDGKPYRYGEKWLYWTIPENDLAEIKSLFVNKAA